MAVMANCTKCHRVMRSDRQSDLCKQCASTCHCGNKKDFRANECLPCGMSRKAKVQWQDKREQMVQATTEANRERWKGYEKPFVKCSVDGCEKGVNARGMCSNHYQLSKRYGDPLYKRPTPEERFWQSIEKTDTCWLWKARTNEHGYGIISIDKKPIRAHRFSYFLHYGEWPMPEGRHTCDNPPCVRPDHIVAGTHFQNMRDALIRGRTTKGEKNAGAKLTDDQVREIKRRLRAGEPQKEIAKDYDVGQTVISRIRSGKRWSHIE